MRRQRDQVSRCAARTREIKRGRGPGDGETKRWRLRREGGDAMVVSPATAIDSSGRSRMSQIGEQRRLELAFQIGRSFAVVVAA